MQREDALDALAERHLAHRERGAHAAAVQADDHALEDLDAFLVAFLAPSRAPARCRRTSSRGRSVSCAFSTIFHRGHDLLLLFRPLAPAIAARAVPALSSRQRRVVQQIRPPLERPRAAPAARRHRRISRVMPRQQHVRHLPALRTPRAACSAGGPATRFANESSLPPTARRRRRPAPAGSPRRRSTSAGSSPPHST